MSFWHEEEDEGDGDAHEIQALLKEMRKNAQHDALQVALGVKKHSETARAKTLKKLLMMNDKQLKAQQLEIDDTITAREGLLKELPTIYAEVAACTERLKNSLVTGRNVVHAIQCLKMATDKQKETERCICVHTGDCAVDHFLLWGIKDTIRLLQATVPNDDDNVMSEEDTAGNGVRHDKKQEEVASQQYIEGIEMSDKEFGVMLNEFAALDEESEGQHEGMLAFEAFVRDPSTGKWHYSVVEMERVMHVHRARAARGGKD